MRHLRIGYGGIGVESSSFTPLPASLASFRQYRGEAMIPNWLKGPAQELAVELVPLFHASSTPSGHVDIDSWNTLKSEYLERLKESLPLDGLLIRAHGSTIVGKAQSGELDLLRDIRKIVGPELPISWPADLHGNIPGNLAALCTIITAYRTAPHVDGVETVIRGLRLLADAARNRKKIYLSHRRVPVLLPGEKVVTESDPGKTLYAKIPALISELDLVDCSIFVGFGWADTPQAGASVIALSRNSLDDAETATERLASDYWSKRNVFCFEGLALEAEQALDYAIECSSTCFVSDSGDNISAGAPGDSVFLLKIMVERGISNALFAPLVDSHAVDICRAAGEGALVEVSIGGTLSNSRGISVTGKVAKILTTESGVTVLLEVKGIQIVLLSKRGYFYMPEEFATLGVDLLSKQVVVIKLGYLFPELRGLAKHSVLCLTPGPSDLVLERFNYQSITRPIFPLDDVDGL